MKPILKGYILDGLNCIWFSGQGKIMEMVNGSVVGRGEGGRDEWMEHGGILGHGNLSG